MPDFAYFILTLFFALAGGLVSRKLKLPAGAMLGALAAVVIFNLLSGAAYVPRDSRVVLQILAGIVLGSGIQKKDVLALRSLLKPTLILISSMIVINLAFGYLMYQAGGLDLATALFATAPGGLTDMALIADEIGADMLQVSSLQLFRILFIFATLPALFIRITSKHRIKAAASNLNPDLQRLAQKNTNPLRQKTRSNQQAAQYTKFSLRSMGLTTLAAVLGGLLLWRIGVNAGALIGSMLAVAAFNIKTNRAVCPRNLRTGVQIAAGAFIGQSMDKEGLIAMQALLIPMLIMVASILTFTLFVSFCMKRLTELDLATCLLASAPGGLQEMALIADDLNGDPAKVIVLQTTRLMTVIIFFPTMLIAAAKLFI